MFEPRPERRATDRGARRSLDRCDFLQKQLINKFAGFVTEQGLGRTCFITISYRYEFADASNYRYVI